MALSTIITGHSRMLSGITRGIRVARSSDALRNLLAPSCRTAQQPLRIPTVASASSVASEPASATDAAADTPLMSSDMTWPSRSHGCGSVTEQLVGQEVTVCGWVDGYRNFGGVLFLDIRDHTGLIQVSPADMADNAHSNPNMQQLHTCSTAQ